jgi:nucleotide-binding universal stress UspA family protein
VFQNILIAYDGSEHARRAAQITGELGRQQPHAVLWLVVVVETIPKDLGSPYADKLIVKRTHEGEELIRKAKGLIGKGISVNEVLLFASPAESIIEVAETRKCDLIIMGTRGLGSLRGLLLGSQIHKVINLAKCPVLAVK